MVAPLAVVAVAIYRLTQRRRPLLSGLSLLLAFLGIFSYSVTSIVEVIAPATTVWLNGPILYAYIAFGGWLLLISELGRRALLLPSILAILGLLLGCFWIGLILGPLAPAGALAILSFGSTLFPVWAGWLAWRFAFRLTPRIYATPLLRPLPVAGMSIGVIGVVL